MRLIQTLLLVFIINSCTSKKVNSKVEEQAFYNNFSIKTLVKDFKGDSSIKEVKGIQTNKFFLYVEYCVYTGKKNRVLNGINKIENKSKGDLSAQSIASLVTKEQFYNDIIPEEKDSITVFFWRFEKLKRFEIYSCIKPPLRHYIIFDSGSDTVYHRIEELAN